MNTAVSRLRRNMTLEDKLEDREIEKAFNKSMKNLVDVMPAIQKLQNKKTLSDQKGAILEKSFELLKDQKLSVIDCGIIEHRLNIGQELSEAHKAILGLDLKKSDVDIIDSFQLPKKPAGSRALQIDQVGGKTEGQRAEREPDLLSANSQAGEYSFINMKGDTITVSRGEILRKVGQAFKAGKIDLITSGQVEYRLNHNGKLDNYLLRYLFE